MWILRVEVDGNAVEMDAVEVDIKSWCGCLWKQVWIMQEILLQ